MFCEKGDPALYMVSYQIQTFSKNTKMDSYLVSRVNDKTNSIFTSYFTWT